MTDTLERLKMSRRAHRGVATRYIQEAKTLLDTETMEDRVLRRLKVLSDLLREKARELKEIDERVLAVCPMDEIEREVEEAEGINARVVELQAEIETVTPRQTNVELRTARESLSLMPRERINTERTTVSGAPAREVHNETVVATERDTESNAEIEVTAVMKPKLPKITLPRFNGEITKFRAFWDRFQSAVDNNTSISPVDKFNYLHALVEGPAARSIQGLQLTEGNYEAAKQILQE